MSRKRAPAPAAVKPLEQAEVSVAELAVMAAPYNPRTMPAHDMNSLRRSMRFFGCVEPVIVNRRSNLIVGGHQRVRAAVAESLETLPVVFVDLDEPSERQLNLALNRISGTWDPQLLQTLLSDLSSGGAELTLTGFSDEELGKILAEATAEEQPPGDFASPSEQVDHTCPRCGYQWAK